MKHHKKALVAGFLTVSLAGCSSSSLQSSLEPKTPVVNPVTQSKLQFAMGTANIQGLDLGVNAVETFRQTSGSSVGTSILENAPTITGPAGFTVPPTTDAGLDAGTAHISGTNTTSLLTAPPVTTFNPDGGIAFLASSWGIFPATVTNQEGTPNLSPAAMPFYAAEDAAVVPLEYIGGPPAFTPPGHTSTQDGTFPSGYDGYELGISSFLAPPVGGGFTLSVVVPTGINADTGVESYATVAGTSTLATPPLELAAWTAPPVFTADGTGGGTVTTNFPGDPNVTEEFIEVVDNGGGCYPAIGASTPNGAVGIAPPFYYTLQVPVGTATVTLPDDIGPALPGKPQGHTICTATDLAADAGDDVQVYGFAVDYPIKEAGFPASTGVAAPAIVGSVGTDDITFSGVSEGTADGAGSTTAATRRLRHPSAALHRVR